jgi:uncharacterized protein YndB with AHSA1/START domain
MEKQVLLTKTSIQELVIPRIFNAPRELVWEAWTNPVIVQQWWGPRYFTTPYIKIDFRIGGEFQFYTRAPHGKYFWNKGVYQEILFPERIVATYSFSDERGDLIPAAYYGLSQDFPLESLITLVFEEFEKEKTKFTILYQGIPDKDFEKTHIGWNDSLDKLADSLEDIENL